MGVFGGTFELLVGAKGMAFGGAELAAQALGVLAEAVAPPCDTVRRLAISELSALCAGGLVTSFKGVRGGAVDGSKN